MSPLLKVLSAILPGFILVACTGLPAAPETGPSATVSIALPVQLAQVELSTPIASATAVPTAAVPATPTQPPTPVTTATGTPVPSPPQPPTVSPTASATPCAEIGRIETGVYSSPVAGEMTYRVYLPPCYQADGRAYPALYIFGGNIHTDSIWDELGLDETAELLIQAGSIEPLIIVMAGGGWIANETSSGPFSFEGVVTDILMPIMESRYCLRQDPDGRAIGGLSRGGYWSLEIAFRNPHLFQSVGGHSFALLDSHAGPDADPVSTGVTNDLGDLRIYLDIGRNDYLLPQAQPLHESLTAGGVAHEWHLNDGTHENAYWSAHLADYLQWYDAGWIASEDSPPCGAG